MSEQGRGQFVRRIFRLCVYGLSVLAFLQLALAIIGFPPCLHAWFAGPPLEGRPGMIVVMGGGGIPSESGLMRTYHASIEATNHPLAKIIVSLPADADPETSSVGLMRDELVMRGIDRDRISMEHRALNTYQQAQAIYEMIGEGASGVRLLLVTSPSHGRRSVLCFRKAGFENVGCSVAVSESVDADMGKHLLARYGFWRGLEMQARYGRELTAIVYYKLRGRI
jgi:uncharacterized SAM-binding protein YcdF (DUF218 family)